MACRKLAGNGTPPPLHKKLKPKQRLKWRDPWERLSTCQLLVSLDWLWDDGKLFSTIYNGVRTVPFHVTLDDE